MFNRYTSLVQTRTVNLRSLTTRRVEATHQHPAFFDGPFAAVLCHVEVVLTEEVNAETMERKIKGSLILMKAEDRGVIRSAFDLTHIMADWDLYDMKDALDNEDTDKVMKILGKPSFLEEFANMRNGTEATLANGFCAGVIAWKSKHPTDTDTDIEELIGLAERSFERDNDLPTEPRAEND